ncbi:hypothetical protein ASG54_17005 [Aureimonas sp. Leaf460]|nr:hypothetical protein ASG62_20525 [Aureimonas sp. Leaf427]KQT73276.1 hypothetical protein ASG54_17005 [Aureimonas sp. Leaf460]
MDDRFDRFIDERAGSDDYETAEDVVRAGLRLLEEQEDEMKQLRIAFGEHAGPALSLEEVRQAIRDGEASGEAGPLDVDAMFEEIVAEAEARR